MNPSLPSLGDLAELSPTELKVLFRKLVSEQLPARPSRNFLLGNLAWALQARQAGKSPSSLRQRLLALSERQRISPKARYLPGTRLIREWHGVTHEVIVEEKGFRWQGREYASLSQIAQAITGARWSGPRFFSDPSRDAAAEGTNRGSS